MRTTSEEPIELIDAIWNTFAYTDDMDGILFGIQCRSPQTDEVLHEEDGFFTAYDANVAMADFIIEAKVLQDNGMTALAEILDREYLN